jgi:hypothetical protein
MIKRQKLVTKKTYDFSELQIVYRKLQKISQRKTHGTLFHATSDADIIEECKVKIKKCMDMFNVCHFIDSGKLFSMHFCNKQTIANLNIWQATGEILQVQEDIKVSLAGIAQAHDQSAITYE